MMTELTFRVCRSWLPSACRAATGLDTHPTCTVRPIHSPYSTDY